jgi:hypothetical protein
MNSMNGREEKSLPYLPVYETDDRNRYSFWKKKSVLFKDPLTGYFTVQNCLDSQTALNQTKSSGET